MKIPFIDLQAVNRPFFTDYQKLVKEVIESCAFTLSPSVEEFEKAFANYLGGPTHAAMTADHTMTVVECLRRV